LFVEGEELLLIMSFRSLEFIIILENARWLVIDFCGIYKAW